MDQIATLERTRFTETSEVLREGLDADRAVALAGLTGQFAHELRNALTGLRCYLELLGSVELPPPVGGLLGEVEEGLDRALDLTARWVEVARRREPSEYLNAEINRLVGLLRASGFARSIRIEVALDEETGPVAVAPRGLEAALLILVSDLLSREPQALRIRSKREGQRLRLTLAIEGPTVATVRPAQLARIGAALGSPVRRTPGGGFELLLPLAEP